MDFVEEKTPEGIQLKIIFNKWQFLAFNSKGSSIYADREGRSLLYNVPLIIFVGKNFVKRRDYDRDYSMLKIRKGAVILPYLSIKDNTKRYIFIQTDKELDMIPVRLLYVESVAAMIKEIDIKINPDFIIVDESISSNDIIIIKNRYRVDEVIHSEMANHLALAQKRSRNKTDGGSINLNMLSSNPVFLASIHLKSMDLSKINQLLLDFELTPLDTEYILNFIEKCLAEEQEKSRETKNLEMLLELRDSFKFYFFLLQKSSDDIDRMINSITDLKRLTPFRTLISKVKSIYPGREEQLLYTEYENLLMEKKGGTLEKAE